MDTDGWGVVVWLTLFYLSQLLPGLWPGRSLRYPNCDPALIEERIGVCTGDPCLCLDWIPFFI